MKGNLVNPFKDKYPQYLSFSMTILLLALTFFSSMIIALQSQKIRQISNRFEQKISKVKQAQEIQDNNLYTYSNPNLGISIKYPDYPSGVVIKENNNHIEIYRKTPEGPYEYAEFPEFQITLIENETHQTKEDWIKHQSDIRILLTLTEYSNLKWENHNQWLVSSEPIATFGNEHYAYGFVDSKIVKITSTKPRNEFLQIIATFKFLETAPETQNPIGYESPAAGVCNDVTNDPVVTAIREADFVFSPRCLKVTPNQRLKIINNSNLMIEVDIAEYNFNIEPGDTYEFTQSFGEFLGHGVHSIGGVEVWVQQ